MRFDVVSAVYCTSPAWSSLVLRIQSTQKALRDIYNFNKEATPLEFKCLCSLFVLLCLVHWTYNFWIWKCPFFG